MWKITKITPENTSWDKLLQNWEVCNIERLEEQSKRIHFENQLKHWRSEADKFERLMNEARKERDNLKTFNCK